MNMAKGRNCEELKARFEAEALEHLNVLYGSDLRLTRNERDAEDHVQETFLKAYRFFHRYEQNTNIKAWLFTIMHNTFVNKYRQAQKERTAYRDAGQEGLLERYYSRETAEGSKRPEEVFFDGLLSDDVKRALEELPYDFRMPIILADLNDFSYKEISEVLGCPMGTVMSRLYRGRKLLKKALHDYAVREGIIKQEKESSVELIDISEERRRRK